MIVYLARPPYLAKELNCHVCKQLNAPGDSQNYKHLLSVGLGTCKVNWDVYICYVQSMVPDNLRISCTKPGYPLCTKICGLAAQSVDVVR